MATLNNEASVFVLATQVPYLDNVQCGTAS
jgi:hypothetical protein